MTLSLSSRSCFRAKTRGFASSLGYGSSSSNGRTRAIARSSGIRQAVYTLCSAARARLTLARMSFAPADHV